MNKGKERGKKKPGRTVGIVTQHRQRVRTKIALSRHG